MTIDEDDNNRYNMRVWIVFAEGIGTKIAVELSANPLLT